MDRWTHTPASCCSWVCVSCSYWPVVRSQPLQNNAVKVASSPQMKLKRRATPSSTVFLMMANSRPRGTVAVYRSAPLKEHFTRTAVSPSFCSSLSCRSSLFLAVHSCLSPLSSQARSGKVSVASVRRLTIPQQLALLQDSLIVSSLEVPEGREASTRSWNREVVCPISVSDYCRLQNVNKKMFERGCWRCEVLRGVWRGVSWLGVWRGRDVNLVLGRRCSH